MERGVLGEFNDVTIMAIGVPTKPQGRVKVQKKGFSAQIA
jgi:hypothetical protein